MGSRPVLLSVDDAHDGQRLDNCLLTLLKGVPKSHVYKIIRKGEVRINKGRAKQTTRLKAGDQVRIPPIKLQELASKSVPESHRALLDAILFEDDVMMVINKPSGFAVHAGSGIRVGVIEAMRSLRSDLPYLELAHRLDRETSGCLMMAKKTSALRALNAAFAGSSPGSRRLKKTYLALVKNKFAHGQRVVDKPLDTHARRGGERHVRISEKGNKASSILRPLGTTRTASFLQIRLRTGRTHQARVHCMAEGHPIAGDQRYGDREFNLMLRQRYGLNRLFLHASELAFQHPVSDENIMISAPLPAALQAILAQLGLGKS